jgi:hypothetical protein
VELIPDQRVKLSVVRAGRVSQELSSSSDRAKDYRQTAERLRGLSTRTKSSEVSAELRWLANSYERLADDPTAEKIEEGCRSLELFQQGNEGATEAPSMYQSHAPLGSKKNSHQTSG